MEPLSDDVELFVADDDLLDDLSVDFLDESDLDLLSPESTT